MVSHSWPRPIWHRMRNSLPRDPWVLKTLRKQGQAKTGDAVPESLRYCQKWKGVSDLRPCGWMNGLKNERSYSGVSKHLEIFFNMWFIFFFWKFYDTNQYHTFLGFPFLKARFAQSFPSFNPWILNKIAPVYLYLWLHVPILSFQINYSSSYFR